MEASGDWLSEQNLYSRFFVVQGRIQGTLHESYTLARCVDGVPSFLLEHHATTRFSWYSPPPVLQNDGVLTWNCKLTSCVQYSVPAKCWRLILSRGSTVSLCCTDVSSFFAVMLPPSGPLTSDFGGVEVLTEHLTKTRLARCAAHESWRGSF